MYPELIKLGGEVVALSVDDMQGAVDMKDAFGIEFPVLYDTDTSVASRWGLYDLLGDGVSAPATFVIRTDGTVESALIGRTIGERPTAESILDVLAALAGMDRAAMAKARGGSGGLGDLDGAPLAADGSGRASTADSSDGLDDTRSVVGGTGATASPVTTGGQDDEQSGEEQT